MLAAGLVDETPPPSSFHNTTIRANSSNTINHLIEIRINFAGLRGEGKSNARIMR